MPQGKKTGTDVATRETTDAVPADLAGAFAEDAGQGLETMSREDKAIPFIALIQSLSPQRKKDNPRYIEGAEEGDIFNTVTGELFKPEDGLEAIPVYFRKVYNVWTPRDAGGGYRGTFASREEAGGKRQDDEGRFGRYYTDDGDEVIDTAEHYLLVRSGNTWTPALLSMTSTKLKISRAWNTRMSLVTVPNKPDVVAPIFARTYMIRSAGQKNEKGEFFNYVIGEGRWVTTEEYQAAKAFRESLIRGDVKVDYTKSDDAAETDDAPESQDEPQY